MWRWRRFGWRRCASKFDEYAKRGCKQYTCDGLQCCCSGKFVSRQFNLHSSHCTCQHYDK